MAPRSHESLAGSLPLIAFAGLLVSGGAFLIATTSPTLSLGAGLLLVLLVACFLHTELALHVILLSMLLSPEIVVGSVGGISIGKPLYKGDMLVLRIEDLILTGVTLAWLARTAIFKELGLVRRTPLNVPMLAYIVSMTLATLLGVWMGNVRPVRAFFFTLKYFEYFVVFFMTVNYAQEESRLKRLLFTAFATCAISSVMGILQIPSGERVGAPFEGKFGEPNTFGGYLVLMLAMVLAMALATDQPRARLGWSVLAGLIGLPLLYTLSRSSWLACGPMLLTLVAFSRRRHWLLGGLAVALFVSPLVLPKQVVDRYNYTLNASVDRGEYKVGGARLDTSTSARLDSWRIAVRSWVDRPFFGYGVAGYGFIDAQYFRILLEGGLIGLAAFAWLLFRLARTGWRSFETLRGTRFDGLPLGFLAGLVAMAVHAIGANTFIIVRIMEPFWFLAGIVTILPMVKIHPGSGMPGAGAASPPRPLAARKGDGD